MSNLPIVVFIIQYGKGKSNCHTVQLTKQTLKNLERYYWRFDHKFKAFFIGLKD